MASSGKALDLGFLLQPLLFLLFLPAVWGFGYNLKLLVAVLRDKGRPRVDTGTEGSAHQP